MKPRVLLFTAVFASSALAAGARALSLQAPAQPTNEARAVAYLAREVPEWRREHPCYSCHNNGDAVRALIAARGRGPDVRAALDGTLKWLGEPERWDTNGGGEGGADDKPLARIQFAHAATTAAAAGLIPHPAIESAAAIVAADQQPDGSWRLDSSDSLGSPATYGTALATVFARRTLVAARLGSLGEAVARADRWLARVEPHNVPDAAAVLFAVTGSTIPPPNWRAAIELLKKSQGRDGGWGPYVTSPAEPFDTALATLALSALRADPSRAEPSFDKTTLAEAIAEGRAFLVRQQLNDGSWNETTRPAGQSSYAQRISTTAWALLALIETEGMR